jgi:hypothetical protein
MQPNQLITRSQSYLDTMAQPTVARDGTAAELEAEGAGSATTTDGDADALDLEGATPLTPINPEKCGWFSRQVR